MQNIIVTTISSILLSVITFFLARRKYLKEVDKAETEIVSNEIDNVEKATRIWRQLSEDITARLTADIAALRSENEKTREKLNALTRENNALRSQMSSLQKELRLSNTENEKLLRQLKVLSDHLKG